MMTFLEWRRSYTPDDVYQSLCYAGLGDMSQDLITQRMYDAAMRGEVVHRTLPKGNHSMRVAACARCGKQKQNRVWRLCLECRAADMRRKTISSLSPKWSRTKKNPTRKTNPNLSQDKQTIAIETEAT